MLCRRPEMRNSLGKLADIIIAHGEEVWIDALADQVQHHGALEVWNGQRARYDGDGIAAIGVRRRREIIHEQLGFAERGRLIIEPLKQGRKILHSLSSS